MLLKLRGKHLQQLEQNIFLIFLVIFPIILNAQSFDLVCKKNDNEITEKSLIKDTSPNTIEIITQDTSLKSFKWDAQNLEMHFETLNDPNIKLKIGSKGYADIKNAVFFELKNKDGYLYQYSKEGVSYNCVNNQ